MRSLCISLHRFCVACRMEGRIHFSKWATHCISSAIKLGRFPGDRRVRNVIKLLSEGVVISINGILTFDQDLRALGLSACNNSWLHLLHISYRSPCFVSCAVYGANYYLCSRGGGSTSLNSTDRSQQPTFTSKCLKLVARL